MNANIRLNVRELFLLTRAAEDGIPEWCYIYFRPQIQDSVDDLVNRGLVIRTPNQDYIATDTGRQALRAGGER